MLCQCKYIEHQEDVTKSRKGGLLIRGAARTERQPVHLLFVLDTSGSMEDSNKLDHVKRSINFLLPHLTSDDQISLVTFSSVATTHLTRVSVTPENKRAIEYTISKIQADNSTNLSAGLLVTTHILQAVHDDTRKQSMIILTDGYINDGVKDESMLLELVKSRLQMFPGLSISCIAYGQEHNADLLSKVAIEGGGSYNIVQNLEDVASVFGEVLGGLLSISAQMVEVRVPPGTVSDAVYPSTVAADGSTTYRIGDLYAESEQILLFESIPSDIPIQVTGIALPHFVPCSYEFVPVLLPNTDEPDPSLLMADYRSQVSQLLKLYRTSNVVPIATLKDRAKNLRLKIESSSFRQSTLAAMMMEDLHMIIHVAVDNNLASQTIQHETFLSVARGLRTPSQPMNALHRIRRAAIRREEEEEEEGENPQVTSVQVPPAQVTSVFSNAVQRNLTEALRTVSHQPAAPGPSP